MRGSLAVSPEKIDFEKNIIKVANMDSVCNLKGDEFKKGEIDLITQVTKYFESLGGTVQTKYGKVIIDRRGVKSSIGHGLGRNKAISFKSIPYVFEKGEIICYINNYDGKQYDRAVFFCANNYKQNPLLCCSSDKIDPNSNKFYLHEVNIAKK